MQLGCVTTIYITLPSYSSSSSSYSLFLPPPYPYQSSSFLSPDGSKYGKEEEEWMEDWWLGDGTAADPEPEE